MSSLQQSDSMSPETILSTNSPSLLARLVRGRWVEFRVLLVVCCGLALAVGLFWSEPMLLGGGAIGICLVSQNANRLLTSGRFNFAGLSARWGGHHSPARDPVPLPEPSRFSPAPPRCEPPMEACSTTDLVDSLVATGRYALLLREETSAHLTSEQVLRAARALDATMSLCPGGKVLIGLEAERATLGGEACGLDDSKSAEGLIETEAYYLDQFAVSNRQYQHFVDAGGYEQLEFWPEEALPAIFDFVDRTGAAGPKFWTNGRYPEGEAELPVVGLSWYEASAYARWVGKRLPTDAEWTKAGAWPVEAAPGRVVQRRYPWGDSFDTRRANLWCAQQGRILPVDSYAEGDTLGGIRQLIGNVWEWTASNLSDSTPRGIDFPSSLRSVRGGAYDTYFENQATCHFQSGEGPLSRRHNIGLRLALSLCELVPLNSAPQ